MSAKGDPVLRVIAERWKSAAPPVDAVFEYHAARPGGGAHGAMLLDFGPVSFAVQDFRFVIEVDDARRRVHVDAWHPSFATAPQKLRMTATFIALDSVLGEDDVERWIGSVDVLPRAPDGGIDFFALLQVTDRLRPRAAERRFAILRGALPSGDPLFVSVDLALKRVDHLLLDTHAELESQLHDPTSDGLSTSVEAQALSRAEDALHARLGDRAVFIARETREGRRVLHFHIASDGGALATMRTWAREIDWETLVRASPDPSWRVLERW
ncbi:DUF695 domain-containing protein [Sandaracinus amylolyticus]|uniref:DUF695 domain-containing protein n=1 Tax=Sandaracinus amylolyticus TaxID=927083 RepID=UPI0012ECEB0A|nr:DUF695 domain-containing protein [Sandaracinus amylolyticus]